MQASEDQVIAGQAVYTHRVLSLYDIFVLGISNRYIWKCSSPNIEDHYNKHVSSNHLEVGAGTGYFLNCCKFPSDSPRIVLMDMNQETLAFASNRIARCKPETNKQNILEKIKNPMEPFDSVGFNYLFHCLPGRISENALALDHLKKVMNPDAQIFGSTILHDGVRVGWMAEKLMSLYNKKGIFSNLEDDLEGLKSSLSERFKNVSVEVIGCVGLFSASV